MQVYLRAWHLREQGHSLPLYFLGSFYNIQIRQKPGYIGGVLVELLACLHPPKGQLSREHTIHKVLCIDPEYTGSLNPLFIALDNHNIENLPGEMKGSWLDHYQRKTAQSILYSQYRIQQEVPLLYP